MRLPFDPFQIFKNSRTPSGLYARKKWLHQSREKSWQIDFNKTVSELLQGQAADGSWHQSPIRTIRRLFGLHLTVRERTGPIEKALHWLLANCMAQFPKKRLVLDDRLTYRLLRHLPFSPGCSAYFLYGATLFLSSIFGMGKDERVLLMYQALSEEGIKDKGCWCGLSCTNNILRAFIVHPDFASHKAIELAVKSLAHEQAKSGLWKRPIPFYQTVNALAHLDLQMADDQLEIAFKRVYFSQNRDGTWGKANKEWNTFLIIHALKYKGKL